MVETDFSGTIEVVRGELSEARADQIIDFWARAGALEGAAARERLDEVVCVLTEDAGEIAGVNSAYSAEVPVVGKRRFWIYRSFVPGGSPSGQQAMINAAFTALESEFEPSGDGPLGICLLVTDPTEKGPEAIWPETELMFAGYLGNGAQVRIRYFWDAVIGPGAPGSPTQSESRGHEYPLEERYRVEKFGEAGETSPEDVIALWDRYGVVRPAEAQRRVHEVLLVAIDEADGLVGVCSAYLSRHPQLRVDLWHYRTFVVPAHRESNVAMVMALEARDLLEQRFLSGEDTRASGIVYEIENDEIKLHFNRARLLPPDFTFVGVNGSGDHVRVHYFPGARIAVTG
jgi:hypothetical protein